MGQELGESRFYMWRAVVAMAHADGVVTPHELSFINDYIKDIPFSKKQITLLGQDLREPQSVQEMFLKIEDRQDKKDFFALARALSWCDGDYDAQEKIIIDHLVQFNIFEENESLLKESREIVNEVELHGNEWNFKTNKSQGIFEFLNIFKEKVA